MHEEAEPQVVQRERGDVVGQPLRAAQPPQHVARELGALGVMADERHPPVGAPALGGGLGRVVQEGGEAHAAAAGQLVGQRLGEQLAHRVRVLPQLRRARLEAGDGLEHLERVAVDVAVVEDVLLDAAQRPQLREHDGDQAEVVHQLEPGHRPLAGHHALELLEDGLGGDARQRRGVLAHGRGRGGLERELELGRQPRRPQRPQRVRGQRLGAHHPQPPRLEIGATAVRVDEVAAAQRLGHRVDGEVACGEVDLEVVVAQAHDVDVPAVAAPDDPPGAEGAGQLERRRVPGARDRPRRPRGIAGQRDVEVGGGAPEQAVAHRAADDPGRLVADARAGGLQVVAHQE